MGKIVNIKQARRKTARKSRSLETIKAELLRDHGIDLDELMSVDPATTLTFDQFEELTERILTTIDSFCSEYSNVTVQDVFYTLENVRDVIKDNSWDEEF